MTNSSLAHHEVADRLQAILMRLVLILLTASLAGLGGCFAKESRNHERIEDSVTGVLTSSGTGRFNLSFRGEAAEWLYLSMAWNKTSGYGTLYNLTIQTMADGPATLFVFPPTVVQDSPGLPTLSVTEPILLRGDTGRLEHRSNSGQGGELSSGGFSGLFFLASATRPWSMELMMKVTEPLVTLGDVLVRTGHGFIEKPFIPSNANPLRQELAVTLAAGWTHIQSSVNDDQSRVRFHEIAFPDGTRFSGFGIQSPPPVGVQSNIAGFYGHPSSSAGVTTASFEGLEAPTPERWTLLHFAAVPAETWLNPYEGASLVSQRARRSYFSRVHCHELLSQQATSVECYAKRRTG